MAAAFSVLPAPRPSFGTRTLEAGLQGVGRGLHRLAAHRSARASKQCRIGGRMRRHPRPPALRAAGREQPQAGVASIVGHPLGNACGAGSPRNGAAVELDPARLAHQLGRRGQSRCARGAQATPRTPPRQHQVARAQGNLRIAMGIAHPSDGERQVRIQEKLKFRIAGADRHLVVAWSPCH